MDIAALVMKLCRVESRTLVFIVGIVVAAVVVFQVFELPRTNILSLSSTTVKSSVAMLVSNATILNNSDNSYVAHVVVNYSDASELEEETKMDYGIAINDDGDLDDSAEVPKEKNSDSEFILEEGKSVTVRNARSTDNSLEEKAIEFRPGPLEHSKISGKNFKIDDDQKASTSLIIGDSSNSDGLASLLLLSPGISSKDMRDIEADSRISSLSTVSNAKQVMEAEKETNNTLLETGLVSLNNSYTIADISIARRGVKPTTISKMNSFLFQSTASSHSMVSIQTTMFFQSEKPVIRFKSFLLFFFFFFSIFFSNV